MADKGECSECGFAFLYLMKMQINAVHVFQNVVGHKSQKPEERLTNKVVFFLQEEVQHIFLIYHDSH